MPDWRRLLEVDQASLNNFLEYLDQQELALLRKMATRANNHQIVTQISGEIKALQDLKHYATANIREQQALNRHLGDTNA